MSVFRIDNPAEKIVSIATAGALALDYDVVANMSAPAKWIRVGVAGDLKITTTLGTTDTLYGVAVGELVRVFATKIIASGTTAQKITIGV